jgi:hypothetical protein
LVERLVGFGLYGSQADYWHVHNLASRAVRLGSHRLGARGFRLLHSLPSSEGYAFWLAALQALAEAEAALRSVHVNVFA